MTKTRGLRDGMRDALRLVRAGELRDATRVIQAALAGRGTSVPAAPAANVEQVPILRALAPATASTGGEAPASFRRAPAARPRRPTIVHPRAAPLAYRLFAPRDAAGARPLLVMLHGCGQDPDDFARGTRAAEVANALGWYVAFPEQPARANGARCWNWFRPQDQVAETGEPRALLDVVEQVLAEHPIDAGRVYVAGLSAGAAMAVILAARFPERFAAVAAHSGLPFGAAHDVPGAFAAMRTRGEAAPLPPGPFVPLLVVHGEADPTVAPANADALVAQWRDALPATVAHDATQSRIGQRDARCDRWTDDAGRVLIESWRIAGAGHAWSGGDPAGSHTDALGPDATALMLRFFAAHSRVR
jgi:poly(hydroxyalkanoate) depolymerase family esterase